MYDSSFMQIKIESIEKDYKSVSKLLQSHSGSLMVKSPITSFIPVKKGMIIADRGSKLSSYTSFIVKIILLKNSQPLKKGAELFLTIGNIQQVAVIQSLIQIQQKPYRIFICKFK